MSYAALALSLAPWDCLATAWRRSMSVGAMAAKISMRIGLSAMLHLTPEPIKSESRATKIQVNEMEEPAANELGRM